jgi:hypothetical protein
MPYLGSRVALSRLFNPVFPRADILKTQLQALRKILGCLQCHQSERVPKPGIIRLSSYVLKVCHASADRIVGE